jgi:uncharacterized protein
VQLVARPTDKTVIGMIHVPPLPGTPCHDGAAVDDLVARAVSSAKALEAGDATGCLVQTADRVYGDHDDPARVAAMTLVVDAVRRATGPRFLVGVQLMWNAVSASLAVAKVCGASFVRVNALVGATVTASGIVEGRPFEVMQYRRAIDASDVRIVADVQTMHFRWLGGDRTAGEVARAARGAGADAVSVCDPDDDRTLELVADVRATCPDLPVILGGHTHHGNAGRLLAAADGAFVGSCLEQGKWGGTIDPALVRDYMHAVRSA